MSIPKIEIKLVAHDIRLFYAWDKYFKQIAAVSIVDYDILKLTANAIISSTRYDYKNKKNNCVNIIMSFLKT